ncbi:MAG: ribulose phosphate epimerase [Deltaproteobacteria bacterium]|nr:MAG: ribulose phosphate epimerase [Deltaproteobacteria bacterium]
MSPRVPSVCVLVWLVAACGDKNASGGTASGSATSSGDAGTGASTSTGPTSGAADTSASATGTGGTSSSTSSTTTNGSGGFVMQPDSGIGNECDPRVQDCPEGEKCTAWADDGGNVWNANKCVPVMGTGVAGDSCTVQGGGVSGVDDCDVGHICLYADENNQGICVAFCSGENTDCDPGFVCAIYNDGVLPICLDACDPLLQDCPQGQACIDTPNGTFICFSDASGEMGGLGDPCPVEDGENSCDPGFWCGQGAAECQSPKCCIPYCDLSEPSPCNPPNQCVSFYGDPNAAPPEYKDVGVCVIP